MKYLPVPPDLYRINRERFLQRMKPNAIAIFKANPSVNENGDALYPYKANSNIVWLSGVVQEATMVLILSGGADFGPKEVLVIQRPDPLKEKWNGHLLRKEEARQLSGIEEVLFLDELPFKMQAWIYRSEFIYLATNEHDKAPLDSVRPDLDFAKQIMERYPLHRYERAAPILKELRARKTPQEVALIQQAIQITGGAFERVCRFMKAGVMEYEVEAEITHEFLSHRASRHAYAPIIASGDRARILHYIDNNRPCQAGELVLMDFGAEYANYNADLSRTIPVDGRFTKRQKEVYDACLAIHRYAASILKPGVLYADYEELVHQEFEKQLLKIGLISPADIKNQDPEHLAISPYYYHGIGHYLGLEVHDVGTHYGRVEEGMLFTIEPGIYIEEEQMGIRIENNYWMTANGSIDLFEGIPITTEEIEAMMNAPLP